MTRLLQQVLRTLLIHATAGPAHCSIMRQSVIIKQIQSHAAAECQEAKSCAEQDMVQPLQT